MHVSMDWMLSSEHYLKQHLEKELVFPKGPSISNLANEPDNLVESGGSRVPCSGPFPCLRYMGWRLAKEQSTAIGQPNGDLTKRLSTIT